MCRGIMSRGVTHHDRPHQPRPAGILPGGVGMTFIIHATTPEAVRVEVLASIDREIEAHSVAQERCRLKYERMWESGGISALIQLRAIWATVEIKGTTP